MEGVQELQCWCVGIQLILLAETMPEDVRLEEDLISKDLRNPVMNQDLPVPVAACARDKKEKSATKTTESRTRCWRVDTDRLGSTTIAAQVAANFSPAERIWDVFSSWFQAK
ncbi:hypothetical protein Y1Q_0018139 [Alligator mississippiensis]|uniref:Uncharacterized protein n=1 Tax=Alligator mississippiensis TaxID=8496 RepID=A0A151LZM9_ALLMI|nr:hypothetical protein Y1Q_0018139 [Alligator mississippiensis]